MNHTLQRTWSAVLFDLDGTITDSAPAITDSLAHMFRTLELPVPGESELLRYVGPPLLDTLRALAGFNEEQALAALAIYRENYVGHSVNAPVFPGVAGVLAQVHAAGIPLALATSKPESMAVPILEHAGLAEYFQVICGATDDEVRSAKADVVAEALRRLQEAGVDTEHAVMVGDRSYDTLGAAVNGVPTILVEWGYGSPAEAEQAMAVVHSADQLRSLLLG
ncbi:HAD hydrolase-like protein [Agromyces atrinae]|uniref:HAD hydrolase-like protein n=1 Tax=Agromyces atrinae TaxID=592376 RepID=UPI001F586B8E|nr:HAD hydrolase-like protein [Agromyces atrinae]MCI2956924.1 HAD hydrolase-like protein [Agromyces atrinae]